MKKFKLSWALRISLFFYFAQFPNLSTAREINPELILAKMSLEQKVGQLFIVGFPQTVLDQKLKSHIQKNHLGAFLLFKRNILNPQQILSLNRSLHRLSEETTGLLPLIAVDQEGGFVNRVPLHPPLPHAISLGLSRSTAISFSLGEEVGRLIHSLGFNMNLSPVLDLADAKKKSFIGSRSFGADPVWVGALGSAYSSGLLKSFVIPTAKHFPGLGDTTQDPHLVSIVRQDSAKELLDRDLAPFKSYSQLPGEKAIMLSHMIFPQLDEKNIPASFSQKIIRTWLRQELGFDGVVMTDDLHMKASTDAGPIRDGAFKALEAGVDMIMLSWSSTEQDNTIKYILNAYKNSQLSAKDLDEKVLRILKLKSFVAQKNFLLQPSIQKPLSSSTLDDIDYQLFKTKLDLVSSVKSLDKNKQLCIYSSQNSFLTQFRSNLKIPLRTFQMHSHLLFPTLEQSLRTNLCQLNVITVFNWSQAQLAVNLSEAVRKSVLVVNFSSMAFLRDSTNFLARLEVLSPYAHAGRDLARFLNGKISTSLPEVQSPLGLAQSPGVEVQSSRHPSSQKTESSPLE